MHSAATSQKLELKTLAKNIIKEQEQKQNEHAFRQ